MPKRVENNPLVLMAGFIMLSVLAFGAGMYVENTRHNKDGHHDSMTHEANHSHSGHEKYILSSGEVVPKVTISIKKDPMSGYNVFVSTSNFTFAPQNASTKHVSGEGHAHLFIDGKKITRLYGSAYHIDLPLEKGEHTVSVSLNTNDHKALADEHGNPIEASAKLTVE